MIIQGIPLFFSGQILRKEMLVSLADFTYQLGALLYRNCSNGIVSGCGLTTTKDSIIVNPGVVHFEGELYLIKEPLFCSYGSANETRILQLIFHDKVRTEMFITREIDLALTEEETQDSRCLELCRFKLQKGARLRCEYTSFTDRETEFDTINTIYEGFCGVSEATLSPEITRHFAEAVLKRGADGLDVSFALQILAQREPVQRSALRAYLKRKLGEQFNCDTNLEIYHGLTKCLDTLVGPETAEIQQAHKWKMMID